MSHTWCQLQLLIPLMSIGLIVVLLTNLDPSTHKAHTTWHHALSVVRFIAPARDRQRMQRCVHRQHNSRHAQRTPWTDGHSATRATHARSVNAVALLAVGAVAAAMPTSGAPKARPTCSGRNANGGACLC